MNDQSSLFEHDLAPRLLPHQGGPERTDLAEAKAARDEAIARVDENAPREWKDRALDAVRIIARRQSEMVADELWTLVERPHEPRATGAIMRRAARAGYIAATDRHVPVPSKTSHARPVRIWRSLIWKGNRR